MFLCNSIHNHGSYSFLNSILEKKRSADSGEASFSCGSGFQSVFYQISPSVVIGVEEEDRIDYEDSSFSKTESRFS